MMPEFSLKPLAELFRALVFKELRERGLVTQEFVANLMAWRHTSGFSVHNEPRNIPSPNWRECIKKIWEVDPLICPHCQTEMKIVSFITDHAVVRKILKHLDLWDISPPVDPPSSRSSVGDETVYVPCDDGWSIYEEPFIEVQ